MSDDLVQELPEAMRVALASGGSNRSIWLSVFALDARIGTYVLGAKEPLLAQMRIAWWRDQLNEPPTRRPRGDILLDLIGEAWGNDAAKLIDGLDGWEALLGTAPLGDAALAEFVDGRESLAEAIAMRLGLPLSAQDARSGGCLWAMAELAYFLPDENDRALARTWMSDAEGDWHNLPKDMRPLAVLAGLAKRSLDKGGVRLMGDRLSPLAALRLSVFGR